MGKLMYQGIQYTGGGSEGENIIYMTKAEYDQITPEEDQLYGIIDWDSEAVYLIKDGVTVNNATWSSQKMVNTFAQKTQISNPNLLDNGWFTINQRGLSSYTSGSSRYTVDRWKDNQGNADITVNSDGSLTIVNSSASASEFTQYLDNIMENVAGKDMTLSVLFSDGSIKSGNITIPTTIPDTATILEAFDVANQYRAVVGVRKNKPYVIFIVRANITVSIKAIKLEVGSISTLALDTAPNYAEELLKCQRYFYRFNLQRYVSSILCSSYEANRVQVPFKLPIQMRTTPSAILKNTSSVMVRKGGSSSLTVSNINSCYMNSDVFTADFTATGAEAGSVYGLYTNVDGGAYIDFTADL